MYPCMLAGVFKVFGLYYVLVERSRSVADVLFSVATCIVIQRLGAESVQPGRWNDCCMAVGTTSLFHLFFRLLAMGHQPVRAHCSNLASGHLLDW